MAAGDLIEQERLAGKPSNFPQDLDRADAVHQQNVGIRFVHGFDAPVDFVTGGVGAGKHAQVAALREHRLELFDILFERQQDLAVIMTATPRPGLVFEHNHRHAHTFELTRHIAGGSRIRVTVVDIDEEFVMRKNLANSPCLLNDVRP